MVYTKAVVVLLIAVIVYWYLKSSQDNKTIIIEEVLDKRVLITGASSGIGEHTAYEYCRHGANVVLTARRTHLLRKVVKRCEELAPPGHTHDIITADMLLPDQVNSLIPKAVELLGSVDVLVLSHSVTNNVCGFWTGSAENMTMLHTSIQGTFLSWAQLASHALPYLEGNNGSIALMSSTAAVTAPTLLVGYGAAKHATRGFFRGVRAQLEWQNKNVAIVEIIIAAIDTEPLDKCLATLSTLLGMPADFIKNNTYIKPVEEAAKDLLAIITRRESEVWYPAVRRDWYWNLLSNIFPGINM